MTSATDRFRMLLAGALERVCVLEEQLEQAQVRIAELEGIGSDDDAAGLTE